MRTLLASLVLLAMAAGIVKGQSGPQPFIQVGAYYIVSAAGDVPLVPHPTDPNSDHHSQTIRVLQKGDYQWYWVEYDRMEFPQNTNGQLLVYKQREWLNFGQVTLVRPTEEIDYVKTYQTLVGSVKVIPYGGQ